VTVGAYDGDPVGGGVVLPGRYVGSYVGKEDGASVGHEVGLGVGSPI